MRRSTSIIQQAICLLTLLFLLPGSPALAQLSNMPTASHLKPGKQVRIPDHLNTVPHNNDFNNPASEYCYKRSLEGPDIIIFWSKEYGQNPMKNPDTARRFDVKRALKECERFYHFYVDSLKMVRIKDGVTDKYKIIFLVVGGKDNTAYGWGQDSVGVLWTPAVRMHSYPYGVLAHELGHSFQYLASLDYGGRLGGPITEMAAQYMLWQVYPDWLSFENYHLKAFLKQTYLAFEHPANTYHSPFVLEYWSEKYAKTLYSQLLHGAHKGEDIGQVFKRIQHKNDNEFANIMFKGVRRFITWDLPRISKVAAPYRNQHKTKMVAMANGWYKVDTSNIPQNYGYNGIRLQLPNDGKSGLEVSLQFKGLTKKDAVAGQVVTAGWRYGFVAFNQTGETYYSDMGSAPDGQIRYKVPAGTTYLWLVVMGAPKKYVPIKWQAFTKKFNYGYWPYKIKLTGTDLYKIYQ